MRRSSAETKANILAAARRRFAVDGYDRATIRAIAADADIDPSMIIRYYGSKERLFATAAEFDLRLPDLAGAPRDQVGEILTGHFLDRWERDDALTILLRTVVTNAAVTERFTAIFAEQLIPVVSRMTSDRASIPVRAALVATQVLGVALCRYVLELPPVVTLTREQLIAWIGPTIQRYLTSTEP